MPRWTDTHNLRLLLAICEVGGTKGISWERVCITGGLEGYCSETAARTHFYKLRREAHFNETISPAKSPRKTKGQYTSFNLDADDDEEMDVKVKPEPEEAPRQRIKIEKVDEDGVVLVDSWDEEMVVKAEPEPEEAPRQRIKIEKVDEDGVVLLDSEDGGLYDEPKGERKAKRKRATPTGILGVKRGRPAGVVVRPPGPLSSGAERREVVILD